MAPKVPEIVIAGFPKCGTTALMQHLAEDEDIDVISPPKGNGFELPWPTIKELKPEPKGKIIVHKFTAYVYNTEALDYLSKDNPDSVVVLCIRDPQKVIVSWRKMHSRIAQADKKRDHFAYRERDFYASCTFQEYYDKFAGRRLQYDRYFEQLASIVPRDRLVVVSQECLAKGMASVIEYLKARARREVLAPVEIDFSTEGYQGYADRAKSVLPDKIVAELEQVNIRLKDAVMHSGVTAFL